MENILKKLINKKSSKTTKTYDDLMKIHTLCKRECDFKLFANMYKDNNYVLDNSLIEKIKMYEP